MSQLVPESLRPGYSLSPMQEAMLVNHLDKRSTGTDIEQLLMNLQENLNPAILKEAWRTLIARHEVLRTGFHWGDSVPPWQEVAPEVEADWTEQDWRELAPDEQESHLTDYLETDRARGFDLRQPPLMRFGLFRIAETHFQLVWTFHHLLLDGRSFPILLNELFARYEAISEGREIHLEPPRPYREYIDWLRHHPVPGAESFWRNHLQGFLAPNSLRVERPFAGKTLGKVSPGRQASRLSGTLTDQLRHLAEQLGVTLNTLMQGAWSILLSRYSGDEDVVFGAVRACRRSAFREAESMVGLFISTLPVRVQVPPQTRLIPWLQALRQQQVEVRAYERSHPMEIRRWSELPRSLPLFESLVMFENYDLNTRLKQQGGRWEQRDFTLLEKTGFPLTLAIQAAAEIQVRIHYDSDRYDPDTIARMSGHFRTILEGMAANPDQELAKLPLLTEAERRQVLVEWNEVPVEYPRDRCLHQCFEIQTERTPEAVAVVYEGQKLTYRELNRRANRVAHHLRSLGVDPAAPVGLCVERSLELAVGLLGILKAGGAYVPLDPEYPPERLVFMVKDTAMKVLVTQEKQAPLFPSGLAQVVCLEHFESNPTNATELNPVSGVTPNDLAYLIYTSGSTGLPKGVMVTHHNVVRLFQATEEQFHFGPADVWTLFHSFAFDFSVWEMWGAWLFGGKLVVVPYWKTRSPSEFSTLLLEEQVTVLNQTPSAFYPLIAAEETRPAGPELPLRYLILGGEALAPARVKPWLDRHGDEHPALINMYGITETTVHVTYQRIRCADCEGPGLIGKPLGDLQVFLLDPHQQLVPVGIPGEICVGGAGVARGYWKRPELTHERFIPHPFSPAPGAILYRSGDWARFRPDGVLEFLGRQDHQVKIRGHRVELGEIESELRRHPAVRESVVVVREDVPGDKRLVAYVIPGDPAAVPGNELRRVLREKLPAYMVPSAVVVVTAFPLTANGKLDCRALPAPEVSSSDFPETRAGPQTPVEQVLAGLWCEVLGLKQVGIHDNFFELGGHSLLAIQLISRVRRAFDVDLPLRSFFESPTLKSLVAALSDPSIKPGNLEKRAELWLRLAACSEREIEALLAGPPEPDQDEKRP